MAVKVVILDYGMGNLQSIYRTLSLLNIRPTITTVPNEVLNADKIILPGVGCFEKAIDNLKSLHLYDILNECVLMKKVPVLGICLGMQLMAKNSEEGNVSGFGWINARVQKFKVDNTLKYKVPQAGWNTIDICKKESRLLSKVDNGSEFYFLHSYHYTEIDQSVTIAKTAYEYEFVSVIEHENLFGTQFHPEKSRNAGIQILQNFIDI